MMIGVVGKKLGMTRVFTKDGISIPVTVVEINLNRITQIKSMKRDGYNSIQITTGMTKVNNLNKPKKGHFKKFSVEPGRGLWEFKNVDNIKFKEGQCIDVNFFYNIKKVDITGFSKGKGFAGTVKRWNFSMQDASHGNSLSHRVPGSIGQNQTPGKVFKGKKMAGQLGNKRVTIQSLKVISIDTHRNLLLIKGAVPGSTGGDLIVKPAIKS